MVVVTVITSVHSSNQRLEGTSITSTFASLEIIVAFSEVDVFSVPFEAQFVIYVFRVQAPLVL